MRVSSPNLKALVASACLLAPLVATSQADAQTASPEQAATFVRMQKAPVDHDNTFDYVAASVANRDYEGAITALERILAYNPNLSRAKYELGVMYFRLHSYAQAVLHFEDALSDPALDPALARRIEGFLPQARKNLSQSRLSALFQTGYRFNSNLAGLPGSSVVRAFGLDAPSLSRYSKSADSSVFALAEIGHVYDFDNGRGDSWQTNAVGYVARQFRLTSLDAALGDFTTGPKLALSPDMLPGWTIRPYFAASGTAIQERGYASTVGGGVTIGIPVTQAFTLEPGFDVRRVSVRTVDNLPNQGVLSTGVLWTGSLGATWSVTDMATVTQKMFAGRNDADAGGISSSQYGFASSVKFEFAPPVESIGLNWSITPFARVLLVNFDRADYTIDPFVTRRDRTYRVGAQLDMPVTSMFGVNASAQFARYDSNIKNYRASSWSFLIGPTARF